MGDFASATKTPRPISRIPIRRRQNENQFATPPPSISFASRIESDRFLPMSLQKVRASKDSDQLQFRGSTPTPTLQRQQQDHAGTPNNNNQGQDGKELSTPPQPVFKSIEKRLHPLEASPEPPKLKSANVRRGLQYIQ